MITICCTNCGANYQNVDENEQVFHCTHPGCGATFIVEQGKKFAESANVQAERIGEYRKMLTKSLLFLNKKNVSFYAQQILAMIPGDFRASAALYICETYDGKPMGLEAFLTDLPECTPEEFSDMFPYILNACDYRMLMRLSEDVEHCNPARKDDFKAQIEDRKAEIRRISDNYADTVRDVFICYSSAQQKIADQVVQALEASGNSCWISSRNLVPDAPNHDELIKRAVSQCQIILVLCSEDAMFSRDAQKEIAYAEEYGNQRLELKLDTVVHMATFKTFLEGVTSVDATADLSAALTELKKQIHLIKNEDVEKEALRNAALTEIETGISQGKSQAEILEAIMALEHSAYRDEIMPEIRETLSKRMGEVRAQLHAKAMAITETGLNQNKSRDEIFSDIEAIEGLKQSAYYTEIMSETGSALEAHFAEKKVKLRANAMAAAKWGMEEQMSDEEIFAELMSVESLADSPDREEILAEVRQLLEERSATSVQTHESVAAEEAERPVQDTESQMKESEDQVPELEKQVLEARRREQEEDRRKRQAQKQQALNTALVRMNEGLAAGYSRDYIFRDIAQGLQSNPDRDAILKEVELKLTQCLNDFDRWEETHEHEIKRILRYRAEKELNRGLFMGKHRDEIRAEIKKKLEHSRYADAVWAEVETYIERELHNETGEGEPVEVKEKKKGRLLLVLIPLLLLIHVAILAVLLLDQESLINLQKYEFLSGLMPYLRNMQNRIGDGYMNVLWLNLYSVATIVNTSVLLRRGKKPRPLFTPILLIPLVLFWCCSLERNVMLLILTAGMLLGMIGGLWCEHEGVEKNTK